MRNDQERDALICGCPIELYNMLEEAECKLEAAPPKWTLMEDTQPEHGDMVLIRDSDWAFEDSYFPVEIHKFDSTSAQRSGREWCELILPAEGDDDAP